MTAAKFRLVAPESAEVDIHAAIAHALDALLLPPAMWWAMPIGHIQLSGAQMSRLVRIGTKSGLPDIFLLNGGSLYGIEIKRHGGALSKTRIVRTRHGALRQVDGQVETFERLLKAGAASIAIAHSVDEMLDHLRGWGIPLRGMW
jgi:hypothetical protein